MKPNIFFMRIVFLVFISLMLAGNGYGAILDISNVRIDGSDLTLTAVVDGGSAALKAGGVDITFPSDRLTFKEAEAVDGVDVQVGVTGNTLRVGYMVPAMALKRLELRLHFQVVGNAPYILAANTKSMTDDLKGSGQVRPGIAGATVMPVMWSVPGHRANLFLFVPMVSKIRTIELLFDGSDILGGIVSLSDWYLDPVRDEAYLVLPGIELPEGVYPLRLIVQYADRTEQDSCTVIVK